MQTIQEKQYVSPSEIFTDINIEFIYDEDSYKKDMFLSYCNNGVTVKLEAFYDGNDFGRIFDSELMDFFQIQDEFKKQILINWYKDFFNNLPHIARGNYSEIMPHINWHDNFVVCEIYKGDDSEDSIPSIYFLLNSATFQSLLSDEMKYVNRQLVRQLEKMYGEY